MPLSQKEIRDFAVEFVHDWSELPDTPCRRDEAGARQAEAFGHDVTSGLTQ